MPGTQSALAPTVSASGEAEQQSAPPEVAVNACGSIDRTAVRDTPVPAFCFLDEDENNIDGAGIDDSDESESDEEDFDDGEGIGSEDEAEDDDGEDGYDEDEEITEGARTASRKFL